MCYFRGFFGTCKEEEEKNPKWLHTQILIRSPSWNKDQGLSLFCLCFHSLSELCKVLCCKFNDIYDLTLTHLSPAVTCVYEDMQACYTVTYKCARTDTLPHRPKHRQTHTHTSRCNMHAGIINRDGKWCCCRQALKERERESGIRTDLKEGQRVEECRKTAKKSVLDKKKWEGCGWCFALQNNKWIYVRARARVCISLSGTRWSIPQCPWQSTRAAQLQWWIPPH